ncbi:MAG: DinB family protein [Acidobacteria bacterium]|nr:DinB family protein [Acidobacteriota bacterium]
MSSLDLAAFLAHWRAMRKRTLRVLDGLPEGDLEWAPRPGGWSFGDLLRHLGGIERFLWAEAVAGRPCSYPGHGEELGSGVEGVRAYLARCHEESLAIFRALAPEDLDRACPTPGGSTVPAGRALLLMAEHEAHHRGQLHLMAGLRGIVLPQLFAMTEEEVRRLSQAR